MNRSQNRQLFLLLVISLIFFQSCKDEEEEIKPAFSFEMTINGEKWVAEDFATNGAQDSSDGSFTLQVQNKDISEDLPFLVNIIEGNLTSNQTTYALEDFNSYILFNNGEAVPLKGTINFSDIRLGEYYKASFSFESNNSSNYSGSGQFEINYQVQ